jgi:hypothetical protein
MSHKIHSKNIEILISIAQSNINNGIILLNKGKDLITKSEKAKTHSHILQAQGAQFIHNGQATIQLGETLLLQVKEIIFAKKHLKGKV